MTDLLDPELTTAFERAHDAPQWAATSWLDPAGRVRRAAARARARRIAIASAAAVALAGGTLAGVAALPNTSDQVHYRTPPASGGGDSGASGDTGAKWLLTPAEFQPYMKAHPTASPAPDIVPSPAPPDRELIQLQSDIAAAVPADSTTVRTDAADGGARGHAIVWLRLADGTPVAVERYQLDHPLVLATSTDPDATEQMAAENFSDRQTWADGTAYTVATGSAFGYGFDEQTQWSGPVVWTATPDGWFTSWTSPVSTDRLLSWAKAADASFAAS